MVDLRQKIRRVGGAWGPIDPIELFESLPIRSSEVKDLWRPQADALREWHASREQSDTLFKLNTGAGKTLIGLLAAQSLVNETRGRVVYVCSTNQLVEQTKEKAAEYGLSVSTYYNGTWSDDGFERCLCPCVTNYQALLNGKSIFENMDLDAVVFDDAHTAFNTVRDQFSLRVASDKFPDAYNKITELCRGYFRDVERGQLFNEVITGADNSTVLFVPTFISSELSGTFVEVLINDGVTDKVETKFAWE